MHVPNPISLKMVSVYDYSRVLMRCSVSVTLMFASSTVLPSFLIFSSWSSISCWTPRAIDFRSPRMPLSSDTSWSLTIFFEDWIETCDDWSHGCIGASDWLLLVMWSPGWFILGGANPGSVPSFFLWKSCSEIREFI